ncbi:lytic transglycosylase domain-containing protein [Candidatus Saganbacteria bacterium]|nr:lytic transglycosylase domain-containing protein [Candidatus Saganbacteria bacterium]
MDPTAAGVALLFVFVIFSSLGGSHQTSTTTFPPISSISSDGIIRPTTVSSIEPKVEIVDDKIRHDILQFILRFRQPAQAAEVTDAIIKHSRANGVNPKLVTALMRRESGFNPRALSSSGAVGLGQLLPATCKTTGVTDPFDIDDNTKGTVRYMKYLLDKFKDYSDPVMFALAGYLEGPNGIERKKGYSAKTAGYVQDILTLYRKI